jgi:hypothetical protein
MSNINQMSAITDLSCTNILVDLTEEDAETISGGKERFTIRNETNLWIPYAIDGIQTKSPGGGSVSVWTTGKGGRIAFDYDFGRAGVQSRRYNLADGRTYAFRLDTRTSYGGDVELFDVT